MPAQKFTLVLPVAYAPYIVKTTDLESLQKIVEGDLQTWGRVTTDNRLRIHPMFMAEERRWAFADRALELTQLKNNGTMYVNECGMYKCIGNVATINPRDYHQTGGCPHAFGIIVIVLTEKQLLKVNEQWREIVKIYETDEERWENVTDDEDEYTDDEEEEDD